MDEEEGRSKTSESRDDIRGIVNPSVSAANMIQDEEDNVVKTATLLDLSNNISDSEGNESSEEDSSVEGILGETTTKGSISSTGAFFPDKGKKPTHEESSSSSERNRISTTINADVEKKDHATCPPNPLTTVMSNSQLQDFVTQTLSTSQVFQCSIMRDKRGIDRSLYPTYFMYLQCVVNADGSHHDQESSHEVNKDDKDLSASSLKDKASSKQITTKLTPGRTTVAGVRQAFLLCGRRRKKSKTYLIGMDPFDISRSNSIAKLKSNIIGTEFRSLRLDKKSYILALSEKLKCRENLDSSFP